MGTCQSIPGGEYGASISPNTTTPVHNKSAKIAAKPPPPPPPPKRKYKAAVIKEPGGKFVIEERIVPDPNVDEVLIKVSACGVNYNDKFTVNGWMPAMSFPIVPGHEVVGVVEQVGKNVQWPTKGMLVGVGRHGQHCLFCKSCRKGDFSLCPKSIQSITGVHTDGGYAEYMVAHWTSIAEIPKDIAPEDAAPFLCSGITMFNSLIHSKGKSNKNLNDGLKVGDLVAICGIGGLGHLGIQFAKKMGYKVVAISSSAEKEDIAVNKLGADYYVDTSKEDPALRLLELGGAKLIITTSPTSAGLVSDLVNSVGNNGRIINVGIGAGNIEVSPIQIINNRCKIGGWTTGIGTDCTDTLRFAKLNNIQSINEVWDLDRIQEAYDRMASGEARFRVVIKM